MVLVAFKMRLPQGDMGTREDDGTRTVVGCMVFFHETGIENHKKGRKKRRRRWKYRNSTHTARETRAWAEEVLRVR